MARKTKFDESKHPRHPAGTSQGGEFRPGDSVYRPGVPQFGVGRVVAIERGIDNKGRSVPGVRVLREGQKIGVSPFTGKPGKFNGQWFALSEVKRRK